MSNKEIVSPEGTVKVTQVSNKGCVLCLRALAKESGLNLGEVVQELQRRRIQGMLYGVLCSRGGLCTLFKTTVPIKPLTLMSPFQLLIVAGPTEMSISMKVSCFSEFQKPVYTTIYGISENLDWKVVHFFSVF